LTLERCLQFLREGGNSDQKAETVIGYLTDTQPGVSRDWLGLGCILISQYYDTVLWVGNPFDIKCSKVKNADCETASAVLEPMAVKELLSKGW
jgi:hypothetical protein